MGDFDIKDLAEKAGDLKDIAGKAGDLAEKAGELAKKAGISEKDIENVKDKAVDAAKDFIGEKLGK